jgi:hypothetical protein
MYVFYNDNIRRENQALGPVGPEKSIRFRYPADTVWYRPAYYTRGQAHRKNDLGAGKMEMPIGLVLRESGAKLPKTHVVDPIATFRRMKIANWTLPLLLRKERQAA